MSVWPYLPVWPFLVLAAAVSAWWNWRAAVAFVLCIVSVRAIVYLGLQPLQLWLMVLYSVTGFVVLFFVDKVAGGFFAVVGVFLGLSLLGYVPRQAQLVFTELALILGVAASAFTGPSGGLFSPVPANRRSDHSDMVSVDLAAHRRRD